MSSITVTQSFLFNAKHSSLAKSSVNSIFSSVPSVRTARLASTGSKKLNQNKRTLLKCRTKITMGTESPSVKLNILPDSTEAASALASLTAKAAAEAIEAKGSFTVAVAGGSLIKLLGGLKSAEDVQWDKWHVAWVDERCVPHSDPESNYGGAHANLLKDVPIPQSQVYAIAEALCPENQGASVPCAEAYDKTLRDLPSSVLPRTASGLPVFDLLLLGFGPDGHICSLFPGHPLLQHTESSPWILPISDSPKPPPERITFSLPVVNAASKVCFVAVGEGKAEMSAIILESAPKDGSIPAALVEGNVEWVMDTAAASKLTTK